MDDLDTKLTSSPAQKVKSPRFGGRRQDGLRQIPFIIENPHTF